MIVAFLTSMTKDKQISCIKKFKSHLLTIGVFDLNRTFVGGNVPDFVDVTTRIFIEDNIVQCNLYENNEIIEYFEKMIKWINSSRYKNECEQLLLHLKLIVSNRK